MGTGTMVLSTVRGGPSANTRSSSISRQNSEESMGTRLRKTTNSPKSSPKLSPAKGDVSVPKMMVRTGVAFAGMAIASAVIMSDHIAIVIAVAVLQTLVFAELVAVRQDARLETRKIPGFRSLNWFGYFVSMFFIYGKEVARFYNLRLLEQYHFYLVFCLYVVFFLGFVLQLALTAAKKTRSDGNKVQLYKYQFTQLSWTLLI